MELVKFCMETLVWFLGMEKSNHKPFFFFNEFGSKRTLLGIMVVFGSFRLDLELFWFGLLLIWGCMKTKYEFPKFLRRRKLS